MAETAELIYEQSVRVQGDDGAMYRALVFARETADGTWTGWIEFHPMDAGRPVLRTEQETSQPSRVTMEYWASGLEPVYLDGAYARARGRLPAGPSRAVITDSADRESGAVQPQPPVPARVG